MTKDLPYLRPKGPKDPKAPGGRKYLYFEKYGSTRRPLKSLGAFHFTLPDIAGTEGEK